MSAPHRHFNILHVSDLHLRAHDRAGEEVQALIDSVRAARDADARSSGRAADQPSFASIDVIAVTGDINSRGEVDGFPLARELFDGVRALYGLERNRVLFVPGNHDRQIRAGEGGPRPEWDAYGEFVSDWYFGRGASDASRDSVHPVGTSSSLRQTAFVVDLREDLGVTCLLLNAYGGLDSGQEALSRAAGNLQEGDIEPAVLAAFQAQAGGPLLDATGTEWSRAVASEVKRQIDLRALREVAVVGREQLDAFDAVLDQLKVTSAPLALIHHHLFPIRLGSLSPTFEGDGAKVEDAARRNILIDFPLVSDWLAERGCRLVLHGHRHAPFFARFQRTEPSARLLSRGSDVLRHEDAADVDLTVAGTGRWHLDVRQDVQKQYGPGQCQVIGFTPYPIPRYDVAVRSAPYVASMGAWTNRPAVDEASDAPAAPRQVMKLELTLSDIERVLYEAETFFTTDVSLSSVHPIALAREETAMRQTFTPTLFASKWFWSHVRASLFAAGQVRPPGGDDPGCDTAAARQQVLAWYGNEGRDRRTSDATADESARGRFFHELVRRLRDHNRANAVFGLLPAQMHGLYTLGALLFSEAEVEEKAASEFQRSEWRELLDAVRRRKTSVARTHLEDANVLIAQEVQAWAQERGRAPLDILELGFGALRTIRWCVDGLKQLEELSDVEIRYCGIDINEQLIGAIKAQIDDDQMRELGRLRPLTGSGLYNHGSISSWLDREAAELPRVDLLLASYCLHHVYTNRLVKRALLDGTFQQLFLGGGHPVTEDHDGAAGSAPTYARYFRDAVANGDLFELRPRGGSTDPDAVAAHRKEAAATLLELTDRYEGAVAEGFVDAAGRMVGPHASAYRDRVEQVVDDLFPDRQAEAYRHIAELVKPGGLVAIADPNGFSRTFNRQHIMHDWPLVASHFAEWYQVVGYLASHAHWRFRVWRHLRRTDLSVARIQVDDDVVERAAAGTPFDAPLEHVFVPWGRGAPAPREADDLQPLEIEDQHLGYVIVAQKLDDAPRRG